MKKDIVLSIMVSSILAAGVTVQASPVDAADASKVEKKPSTSSGKCASGKCGTEKIYSQAELQHDPQDQLVRARDGKCGLTGKGINSGESMQQVGDGKCVNGVCGK